MAEKNLDFDSIIERKNTRSLKYDFAKRRGMPEDLLPLWVADMDFKTSSYVQEALAEEVEHGIFGYSEVQEEYFEVVRTWMKEHYDWEVSERWLVKTPGIVLALAMAVQAFTEPGDSVLIQLPVYYPFSEVILDNGRKLVSSTLIWKDYKYYIDFEDFEQKIIDNNIKLFLLCNPHNPGGRVWTKEELIKIGDICQKHEVLVVSDEIHADFVFKGKHHVFADLKEEYKDFTITCTSPSKTFNLAGLQISNIFIPNAKIRRTFRRQIDTAGYSQLNVMGLIACEAAYKSGNEWYQAMHNYIWENIKFTQEFVEKNIPGVVMGEQEATYLVWLDFNGLGLTDEEVDELVIKDAKLWLDSGKMFGESGKGFQRINTACPRSILEEALNRLANAVKKRIEQ